METRNRFEVLLKQALATLGFDKDCIKNRREYMKRHYGILSHFAGQHVSFICTGSKAEGMTLCLENDIDDMIVLNQVICLERGAETSQVPVVFELDMSNDAPGYAKLRLSRQEMDISNISALLYDDEHSLYLSSKGFVNCFLNYHKFLADRFCMNHRVKPRAGPSVPQITTFNIMEKVFSLKTDNVLCFPCESQTLFKEWCARERHGAWPTEEMVSIVSSLHANAVPVGERGHVDQDLQWRICFTEAETYLINTLSENLLQVYFILKNLTKCALTPVCCSITSYVVKNIILWIAERLPTDRLDVVPMLQKAVLELKMVVDAEHLPSFMIYKRNLLKNKISFREKIMLKNVLSAMLKEKELMIFRSKAICNEMRFAYKYPQLVESRRQRLLNITKYPELKPLDMMQQYLLFTATIPQMRMLSSLKNKMFA